MVHLYLCRRPCTAASLADASKACRPRHRRLNRQEATRHPRTERDSFMHIVLRRPWSFPRPQRAPPRAPAGASPVASSRTHPRPCRGRAGQVARSATHMHARPACNWGALSGRGDTAEAHTGGMRSALGGERYMDLTSIWSMSRTTGSLESVRQGRQEANASDHRIVITSERALTSPIHGGQVEMWFRLDRG